MAAYEETYKVYLHPVRDEWGLLLSLEAISSEKVHEILDNCTKELERIHAR